jgi:hypothetical protein
MIWPMPHSCPPFAHTVSDWRGGVFCSRMLLYLCLPRGYDTLVLARFGDCGCRVLGFPAQARVGITVNGIVSQQP